MSDNRPPRYVETADDGTERVIYRASSLGMCDKVFVALAMGYDPRSHPAWFQEILDEGTENEQVIREMYEQKTGREVLGVGRVVEMEIMDGVWVRGSIDGHSDDLESLEVYPQLEEYKKVRDSGWMRYLRSGVEFQANYPMQTAFYQYALGEQYGIDYVPMAFTGGHYVHDEKTDTWSITETYTHHYPDPAVPLLAIKKRIAKLQRLISETEAVGDLPCSTKMYPCPFYYLHDDDDEVEPPTRPSDDILNPLVVEFAELEPRRLELGRELKTIEERQKGLKSGIHAWLMASGQESGDVSTVTVNNMEVAVKYLTSPRAGYIVEDGEQTRVTVKVTKKDGEKVANAPKKSAPRKQAAKRTPRTPVVKQGEEGNAEADAKDKQETKAATPKKGLAPRPGAGK